MVERAGHAGRRASHLIAAREFEVKYSKTEVKSYHSEYREKIDEAATALQGLLGRYAAKAQAEDEKALVTHMDKVWLQYRQSQQRVIELGRKSQLDAADIADGASSMLFDEAIASVNALIKFNQDPGFERGGGSRTRR